eukprot:scaffold18281_cov73-Skeletonema_marinoi.AAC.1
MFWSVGTAGGTPPVIDLSLPADIFSWQAPQPNCRSNNNHTPKSTAPSSTDITTYRSEGCLPLLSSSVRAKRVFAQAWVVLPGGHPVTGVLPGVLPGAHP